MQEERSTTVTTVPVVTSGDVMAATVGVLLVVDMPGVEEDVARMKVVLCVEREIVDRLRSTTTVVLTFVLIKKKRSKRKKVFIRWSWKKVDR